MWVLHGCLVVLALIRCHSCSDFQPVRRYHPATKFNSNSQDDLVTAENFQYAYGGGESQSSVDYSHGHEVEVNEGPHHATGPDHTHHYETDFIGDFHQGTTDLHHHATGYTGDFHQGPTDLHHHATGSTGDFHQGSTDLHHHATGFDHDHHHSHIPSYSSGFDQALPHTASSGSGHAGEVLLTSGGDLEPSGTDLEPHYVQPGYSYGPPGHPPPVLPALPALTTPPPAQQAKQSPGYTYYYLGRHLWYIPLYFSIYFILYVGALVLKSVARHKILFPEQLHMAAQQARALRQLSQGERKFYM